jgi:hypothetical protein
MSTLLHTGITGVSRSRFDKALFAFSMKARLKDFLIIGA